MAVAVCVTAIASDALPPPPTPENTNPNGPMALEAPRPDYPKSLKAHGVGGRGVFVLHIDTQTGFVTSVSIEKSTGVRRLDSSAVRALRKWRFTPRKINKVRVPITFVPDSSNVRE